MSEHAIIKKTQIVKNTQENNGFLTHPKRDVPEVTVPIVSRETPPNDTKRLKSPMLIFHWENVVPRT